MPETSATTTGVPHRRRSPAIHKATSCRICAQCHDRETVPYALQGPLGRFPNARPSHTVPGKDHRSYATAPSGLDCPATGAYRVSPAGRNGSAVVPWQTTTRTRHISRRCLRTRFRGARFVAGGLTLEDFREPSVKCVESEALGCIRKVSKSRQWGVPGEAGVLFCQSRSPGRRPFKVR